MSMSDDNILNHITEVAGNLIATSSSLSNVSNVVVNNSAPTVVIDNWSKPFWRSVFSGETGAGSTSRVTTFMIVLDILVIVDFITYKLRAIPDKLLDLGIFAALLICTIYAPAKIADIFSTYFSKK